MRKWIWPAVALGLFVIGGVLMRSQESVETPSEEIKVSYPRHNTKSYNRAKKRRTLLQQVRTKREGRPEEVRNVNVDPMLVALSPGPTNMVIEANAIANSPLGELLLGCMDARAKAKFEEMKKELGIDPLQNLDRIAMGENNQFLFSGHFKDLNLDLFAKDAKLEPYGDNAQIVERGGEVMGFWNDQMVVVGESIEDVQTSIDRLEGRVEAKPTLPSSMQYGEAYGHVNTRFLASLLGDPTIKERLDQVVQQIEFHVDTQEAVAMVFSVKGDDPERLDELARSLGSLMALSRVRAKAEGDEKLDQLLKSAKVSGRGGRSFDMRLAVSMDFLRKNLSGCAPEAPVE